ncbi:uncharacterized protein LOC111627270 [Centruroides sculpturatus]|uniref:uncharacterized protein LOC111627270 n=1 Tax=Centruroides sculpturatus TaxID=218467 RepID=UPI000C6CD509|nr:uncharacterized protein LOC111627270 [Centruroides sculpturatus]
MFVIDADGTKLGVLERYQALELAAEKRLDLVIISANPDQPVAKLLDYGRYKYNRSKKRKEVKAKQSFTNNREVRLTVMIGEHDLDVKAKKARQFLLAGDRVKVSLKFRGREIVRQELGHAKLDQFFQKVADVAQIQKPPALANGRFLDMYLVATKVSKSKKEGSPNAENENQKSAPKKN